jgi:hypothetical protein
VSESPSIIYVIGGEGLAPVKVGVTTNLARRLVTLQTSAPARLSVLWTTPGDSALERELHTHLAAYRTSGEWFDLTPLGDPVEAVRAAVSVAAPALAERRRAEAKTQARQQARRKELEADPDVVSVEFDHQGREVVARAFARTEYDDWVSDVLETEVYGIEVLTSDEHGPVTYVCKRQVGQGVPRIPPLELLAMLRANLGLSKEWRAVRKPVQRYKGVSTYVWRHPAVAERMTVDQAQ